VGCFGIRVEDIKARDLMKRDHLENLGVDGRIILKVIFMKWDQRHGLD
jgi:hypothetical protein